MELSFRTLRIFGIGAGLAAITACTNFGQFHREAGSTADTGVFGNATASNTLIQSGQQTHQVNLNKRFSEEITPTVNFAFNSDVLDEEARNILRLQADWIKQFPEVRFRVYGHTDAVGSEGYNKNLGLRRANAVVAFLSTQGIDAGRLEALTSFGETQPLIVTEGRERRNRRTVTEVSGFVQSHPSLLDGRYAQVIYREYVESATAPTSLGDDATTAAAPQ